MSSNAYTSYNGVMVTAQEYALEIARGRVPGAEPFGSYGEFAATGGEVNRVIWPNGPYKFPSAAGASVQVVSTSPNDAVGGTGVRQIAIHYLDINLSPKVLFVNMNGITPVTVDADGSSLPLFRFFQCIHSHAVGTFGGGAIGQISVKDVSTGDTYALISAGDERCASSARMVPAGKRGIVYGLAGGSVSISADARTLVRVAATELYGYQYTDQGVFMPFGSIGVQNNSLAYTLSTPLAFSSGTVIAMICSPQKAATVTGDWFGWLENV